MAKKMPLNIKKLLDAVTVMGQERDLPVYVDIVYDATASDAMISAVSDAFGTVGKRGLRVDESVLGNEVPPIPLPADLCVIVAGRSLLLGDVAQTARSKDVPTVVVAEKYRECFTQHAPEAPGVGRTGTVQLAERKVTGIPSEDVIEVDLEERTGRPFEELGVWIVRNAPEKRLSMAAGFEFLRHPLAGELAIQNSIQNGAIGVVFFMPGADMPLITLNQAKMVMEIAAVYGQPLDMERAKEIGVVVLGAFCLRGIARQLARVVPGPLGIPLKTAVAFTGTLAMGYAAIDYFEEGGVLQNIAENAETLYGKADKYVHQGVGAASVVAHRLGDLAAAFAGGRQAGTAA